MKVTTEEELGKALNNNENYIEIEGDLAGFVIKIKAKGPVAWAIAIGALVAVVGNLATTAASGGAASFVTVPATVVAGTGAASVLGLSTAIAAVKIAFTAKNTAVLEKMRKEYRIKDQTKTHLVLVKK